LGQPELSGDALHIYDPQAVYIVGHAASIHRVLAHLSTRGIKPIRCTTSAFYVTDVLNRCGELADGVIFPVPAYDAASAADPVSGFAARYQGTYGVQPDIYAAHGYDAMKLAIQTLCRQNAVRAADVRRYLDVELQQFTGVTGTIAFNDHGDATRYPTMHCVWKGWVMSCEELRRIKLRSVREILEDIAGKRATVSPTPTPRGI
jgi:ABC-type branched-subunit amino acid transport system substrate-binding protein